MLPRLLKTLPLLWLLVLVLSAVPLSVPMPATFAAGIACDMRPSAAQTAAQEPPCHEAASAAHEGIASDDALCCVTVFHFCCSPVTAISTALTDCEPAPGREAPPPDVPAASAQTVPSGIFRPFGLIQPFSLPFGPHASPAPRFMRPACGRSI